MSDDTICREARRNIYGFCREAARGHHEDDCIDTDDGFCKCGLLYAMNDAANRAVERAVTPYKEYMRTHNYDLWVKLAKDVDAEWLKEKQRADHAEAEVARERSWLISCPFCGTDTKGQACSIQLTHLIHHGDEFKAEVARLEDHVRSAQQVKERAKAEVAKLREERVTVEQAQTEFHREREEYWRPQLAKLQRVMEAAREILVSCDQFIMHEGTVKVCGKCENCKFNDALADLDDGGKGDGDA